MLPVTTCSRRTPALQLKVHLALIFFTVGPAHAERLRTCAERITTVTLSPDSPKGHLGQVTIGLGRKIEWDLGVAVRQNSTLAAGTIRGVIDSGHLRALEYRSDADHEQAVFSALSRMLTELTELRRLTAAGVRFRFSAYGTDRTRIAVRGFDPASSDRFVDWWRNRVRRRGVRFEFDSNVAGRAALIDPQRAYLAPDLLSDRSALEEAVIHELVHAADLNHSTRNIIFRSAEYDLSSGTGALMPGAPAGYGVAMASSEFEAQFIGRIKNDLAARDAWWAEVRPFLTQVRWLVALRERLARAGFDGRAVQRITYRGVAMTVEFVGLHAIEDPARRHQLLIQILDRRIRQLTHIERVRTRVGS